MPYNNYDSFQGIVDAFNTIREYNQATAKDYPASFEGIRDAVLDIKKEWGNIGTGQYPDGWDEVNGQWIVEPQNGDLWFDQNQGRLMVWLGGAFYQTNGADQLTVISETAPADEVTGGLWYQPSTTTLYLYDGVAWNPVSTSGSTALSTSAIGLEAATETRLNALESQWDGVAAYSTTTGTGFTQERFNTWLMETVRFFDQTFTSFNTQKPGMTVDVQAPASPELGDLWLNTAGDLMVWDGTYWQVATSLSDVNNDIASLTTQVSTQDTANATRFTSIENSITNLPLGDYLVQADLTSAENTLQANIDTLTTYVGDLTRFPLDASVTAQFAHCDQRLDALEAVSIDLTPYATTTSLSTQIANLQSQITPLNSRATTAYVDTEVAAVLAQIPSITGLTTDAAFNAYQATVTNTFLAKTGGTISGELTLNSLDTSTPTLDFSTDHVNGRKAMKFKTYASTNNYVEFGVTTDFWEYAFDFAGNEDFCWKHGTNGKQFSITKDGATAKNLYIADFSTNDANGQVVSNVVDVKAKLTSLENSINTHTADITATDNALAAKKEVYYSDFAPTGTFVNGDMWFDSQNLRLTVRHNNAWVSPDRVEDTVLKTAMYNAVNTSTDYASLKTNLLSALS